MKFSDILKAVFIIFAFLLTYLISLVMTNMNNVKKNWSLYKCNPMIMPFASYFGHDTEKNFTECVAEMQKHTMPIHTAPLSAAQSVLHQNISGSWYWISLDQIQGWTRSWASYSHSHSHTATQPQPRRRRWLWLWPWLWLWLWL